MVTPTFLRCLWLLTRPRNTSQRLHIRVLRSRLVALNDWSWCNFSVWNSARFFQFFLSILLALFSSKLCICFHQRTKLQTGYVCLYLEGGEWGVGNKGGKWSLTYSWCQEQSKGGKVGVVKKGFLIFTEYPSFADAFFSYRLSFCLYFFLWSFFAFFYF